MIRTEFGIIDGWWSRLVLFKTYFHSLKRPGFGLARWGVTLIPPESLPAFQEIVLSDKRLKNRCYNRHFTWNLCILYGQR